MLKKRVVAFGDYNQSLKKKKKEKEKIKFFFPMWEIKRELNKKKKKKEKKQRTMSIFAGPTFPTQGSCCFGTPVIPPPFVPTVTTDVGTLAGESGTSFTVGVAGGSTVPISGATPVVFNSGFSIGSSPISSTGNGITLTVVPTGQVSISGQGSIRYTALVTVPTFAQVVFVPAAFGASTVVLSTTAASATSATWGAFTQTVTGPGIIEVFLGAATSGGTATLVSDNAIPPNVLTILGTFATSPPTPTPFPFACPPQQCCGVKSRSKKHKC
jgi:hypothetical protein